MEPFNEMFGYEPHKVKSMPFLEKILQEEKSRATKRPSMYEVVLMNDDATPQEFIVAVLEDIFHKNAEDAVDITLETHNEGQASCGMFTRDIAETKMIQVIDMARANGFPLKCIMHRSA